MATLIPYMFKTMLPVHTGYTTPALWGYLMAGSTLVGALLGPYVGAYADFTENRKHFLFIALGIQAVAVFSFVLFGLFNWVVSIFLVCAALISGLLVMALYNAMIMFTEETDDIAQTSVWGTGLSSLGSALLMTGLGMAWLSPVDLTPGYFLMCTVAAAAWQGVFCVPLFRGIEEPPSGYPVMEPEQIKDEVHNSIRDMFQNRELVKLTVALLVFNDASTTMWTMHVVYGSYLGIPGASLFGAQVLNRWMSVPFCLLWAKLADRYTSRTNTILAIGVTLICCVLFMFLKTQWEYYGLSVLLALAGTGIFIFTRVLMADLTPTRRAGQNFGILAAVNKLAGFVGPLVYAIVTDIFGSPRAGFGVLLMFAAGGLFLLMQVDIDAATAQAHSDPVPEGPGNTHYARHEDLEHHTDPLGNLGSSRPSSH
eukprot:CAMPEP_0114548410 /NCGR_PEP_ID=MMETSP0114-20121206/4964_1 /TAXON_ID=31324 /ORGANISM="Goniomonas sp, Strain m" /LENGTH=424 /DNA_ID=CAMNT_0001732993 /DNA_START=146 /DNA_END=1420 /DNA_ORIENTATION=-